MSSSRLGESVLGRVLKDECSCVRTRGKARTVRVLRIRPRVSLVLLSVGVPRVGKFRILRRVERLR